MKKIIIAILSLIILVGGGFYLWPNQTVETFEGENYTFTYPQEYSVSETGEEEYYILTVSKNEEAKIEIYKAKEYPVDRTVFGFTGEETAEEVEAFLEALKARSPKEYLTVSNDLDEYDVWLYYNEEDAKTQDELKTIFNSIEVTPSLTKKTDLR